MNNSFPEQSYIPETDAAQACAAILRSLSHDLRTPISNIINASSFYLYNPEALDDEKKTSLVQNVYNESAQLLAMLENILAVSKLYDTPLPFTTTLEAVEEVLPSAIMRLKLTFPNTKVQVVVPPNLLLVPMDSLLFQQTLVTLMRLLLTGCATKHPLECTVIEKEGFALFHLYSPNPLTDPSLFNSSANIAVCKLIVEAHQGIFSSSIKENYSSFSCSLPLGVNCHGK